MSICCILNVNRPYANEKERKQFCHSNVDVTPLKAHGVSIACYMTLLEEEGEPIGNWKMAARNDQL
ncbi:Uncharacterized protein APZ42_024482 [Daphnia magna]|uniref:Uncharacterized protein n=1 Tax=Daphnia magna TaxID=35525 RepID=A0A164U0I1_9CRUS|nr:Uncharacterized protein APZ42_024482 [Daphnia magna]